MDYPNTDQYPVDSLPPIIRNAVLEVQAKTQAPLALIAASALGAVSLACQNSVDVQRPNTHKSPVSIFLLTIATSGERKSSVDKYFTGLIHQFEELHAEYAKKSITRFDAEVTSWEIKRDTLKNLMKHKAKNNEANDELIVVLAKHMEDVPKKPKVMKFLYDDATPESIKSGLNNWPSAGIISDEADGIFNGRAMNNLAVINTIWSGGKFQVERRTSESFCVSDARLTIALMIQQEMLDHYIDRRGSKARDIGFFARTLIAMPTSMMGKRPITDQDPGNLYTSAFQNRTMEILEKNFEEMNSPSFEREILSFSQEAKLKWIQIYNDIERDLGPGFPLESIKDYAAKYAENLARLAALFHYFEGEPGDISEDTIQCASKICDWYLAQFTLIFSKNKIPECEQLEQWLSQHFKKNNIFEIRKNDILQLGPDIFRNKNSLNAALEVLVEKQIVSLVMIGRTNYVRLSHTNFFVNQQYFDSPYVENFRSVLCKF